MSTSATVPSQPFLGQAVFVVQCGFVANCGGYGLPTFFGAGDMLGFRSDELTGYYMFWIA